MTRKLNKSEHGFSLIEIVIVVAVLAVLATILVPKIIANMEDANKSKELSNARALTSEISAYNASVRTQDNVTLLVGVLDAAGNISGGIYYQDTPFKDEDLAKINRKKEDFPSGKYAQIKVDQDGNTAVLVSGDSEFIENVPIN